MMRLPSFLALAAILLFVGTGCSRLTFVKPASKRIAYEEKGSAYSVSDSAATKQRLATQDRLALASQRLQSGDLASAEREATAVLKINPGSADANTILAIVQDQKGNSERAGGYYKRAAELAPTQGAALNNYGAWLCGNGHEAESLLWFDRAVEAPGYNSPASAYANAILGDTVLIDQTKCAMFDADAITLNAYLGIDGIKPFLDVAKAKGKGVYILVRTSNPSAGDFQDMLMDDKKPLYERFANLTSEWGTDLIGESGYSSVGAVVGATWPKQASRLRELMPHTPILVPGYGAQGGSGDSAAVNFDSSGKGAIVNASRSLMCAYKKRTDLDPMHFAEATYDEAIRMRDELKDAIARRMC